MYKNYLYMTYYHEVDNLHGIHNGSLQRHLRISENSHHCLEDTHSQLERIMSHIIQSIKKN